MESVAQEIILSCEINSIERGSLKNLSMVNMSCNGFNVSFDIIDSINIFSQKEKVKVIISKNRPSYSHDDFCGHGYIVTELKDSSLNNGNKYTTIISLYGLLVKIISNKESFLRTSQLNIMDHVYFCVKKNN